VEIYLVRLINAEFQQPVGYPVDVVTKFPVGESFYTPAYIFKNEKNNGKYTLYIRCQDANGNFNQDAYSVSFCVEKGPDTTPPLIVDFNIPSESPVQYNQSELDIEVYVNEPAEWINFLDLRLTHSSPKYLSVGDQNSIEISLTNTNSKEIFDGTVNLLFPPDVMVVPTSGQKFSKSVKVEPNDAITDQVNADKHEYHTDEDNDE